MSDRASSTSIHIKQILAYLALQVEIFLRGSVNGIGATRLEAVMRLNKDHAHAA